MEAKFAAQNALNQAKIIAQLKADRATINTALGFDVDELTFLKTPNGLFHEVREVKYHLSFILFEPIDVTIDEEADRFLVSATDGGKLRCLPFTTKDILADGVSGEAHLANDPRNT
jgi:hypothetical protein